jgi:lipopolysaccharide/colanic/teichoic acid biosynthesis glycosyltransferase
MLQEVRQSETTHIAKLHLAVASVERLRIESTLWMFLKRCTDITVSWSSLLVITPILVALLIINTIATKGHPLFGQDRVGRNGRSIRVYKFRSMACDAEARLQSDPVLHAKYLANGHKLPEGEDPRITRFGRFLRKTSLDELPQLWCVAVGTMSMVGPRPVLPTELETLYGTRKDCYLRTKPGLTGLWQISGRSDIVGEERVDLDCSYVQNWSFLGDLGVLFRTVPAVLLGRGSH